MSKRVILGLLGIAFGIVVGASVLTAADKTGGGQLVTSADACQGHDPDVRVRIDTKHADGKAIRSAVVPETFVACKDDRITWEIHDPSVLHFSVSFKIENPFSTTATINDGAPTSGTVKSPGLGSPAQFKYFKYELTITFRNGTSQVIDPGGIVMGP